MLSGLLRCGHCGAKLVVQYPSPTSIRYQCPTRILTREHPCCVMFGGLGADQAVIEQVLHCLQPLGLEAALAAIENLQGIDDERIRQKRLAVGQARYEAARAQRQYDAVDPANRLVASTLERRWNDAMKMQSQLEEEVAELVLAQPSALSAGARNELVALANDLPRLWEHPDSPNELKKRILRTILKEIIASSDGDSICMLLHWQGGDHTELRLRKTPVGQRRNITNADTIELIRSLARLQSDDRIAAMINRLGHRTAHGQTWTAMRVCSIRSHHDIAVYCEGERQARGDLTVDEVAAILNVTSTSVLRLIRQRDLVAKQACRHAPWMIHKTDIDRFVAARAGKDPQTADSNQLALNIQ